MKFSSLLCCYLLPIVSVTCYGVRYYQNPQYGNNENSYFRGYFRQNSAPVPISNNAIAAEPADNLRSYFRQNSASSPITNAITETAASYSLGETGVRRGILTLAVLLDCILSPRINDSNIVFSPFNIAETLTLLTGGTAGKTYKELSEFLGMISRGKSRKGLPVDALYQSMSSIVSDLNNPSQGIKIANAFFLQNGSKIKPDYSDFVRRLFNNTVELHNVDFTSPTSDTADFINQWVSNSTNGLIKEIVQPPINPLTKVIITSALHFSADWEYPFLEKITKWQPFYLTKDGKFGKTSVQVQMMVNEAKILYHENKLSGIQSIGLPYKNNETVMFIILPKINTSINDIKPCEKMRLVQEIVENKIKKEVMYVIPKMVLDFKTNLRTVLQRSIGTLFDASNANFSNLVDDKIHVTEILHKVEIDVNEIGTTAAAVTSTSIPRGGFINFRADRPFMFFIYNVKYDVMTFWANVKKPTPFLER